MSRATDLRDALIAELQTQLGDEQTIEPFSMLIYEREEFKTKPLILVRSRGRQYLADQGPDEMMVMIDVMVAAAIPPKTATTMAGYRQEIVAQYDEFDDLFQTVLDLWVPDGPLKTRSLANHRFHSFEEVEGFEMEQLHSDGVYSSWIQLKYYDSYDEDDRT